MTKQFIMKRWPRIAPEVLKHYITSLALSEITSLIPDHLATLGKEEKYDLVIEYIWKFDLFSINLDWKPIIKSLLVSSL